MANKGAILQGLRERYNSSVIADALRKLAVAFDTSNRLLVTLSGTNTLTTVTTVTTVTTATTLTNITNWGATSATGRTQIDTQMAYQAGFRRNLVVS